MSTGNELLYQVSEIELVYKSKVRNSQRPYIADSGTAYAVLLATWDENKIDLVEQFKVMLLNQANRVIGLVHLSTGGITSTVADNRLILVAALKAGASGIILAHNLRRVICSQAMRIRLLPKRLRKGLPYLM